MTKELEREAKDYANDWLGEVHELELKHRTDSKPEYIRIQQAYLAGAEPREKRIEELANQLEDTEKELEYAKIIIQELLNNSDEYARQGAMDFLKEE